MDYILLPSDPIAQHPRVACVGLPYAVGQDFLTYPSVAGDQWSHVLPQDGTSFDVFEHWTPSIDQALESFFQTWLFFGLLQELLAPHGLYENSNFLGTDVHGTHVRMELFDGKLRKWVNIVKGLNVNDQERLKARLIACLHLANRCLRALLPSAHSPTGGHPNFNKPLRDSIVTLCATISAAGEQVLKGVLPDADWVQFELFAMFTEEEKRLMQQNGWCPSLIAQEDGSYTSMAYRTFIKNMKIPHVGFDHSTCNEMNCDSESISPKAYVPQHTTDCHCRGLDVLGPPMREVEKCLEGSTFPVINIIGTGEENLAFEVVPYEEGMHYVALSHVWADGLGNPLANALPRCQLRRLQERLRALADNPAWWSGDIEQSPETHEETPRAKLYLWCDTLLVPAYRTSPSWRQWCTIQSWWLYVGLFWWLWYFVEQPAAPNHNRFWSLAVDRMCDVYEKSTFVLVLEKTLDTTALEADYFANGRWIEAYVRFFSTRWTRRLWTLQEVALPPKVLIQYNNRSARLKDLALKAKSLYDADPVLRDLARTLAARFVGLRGFKGLQHGPNILQLYNSVRERRCSRPEDETVCISTILGFKDKTSILSAKTCDDRMRALWTLATDHVHGIPQNIVFNEFPRLLKTPGFHWAPSSLLQDPKSLLRQLCMMDSGRQASLTPNLGLRIRYPGYRIRYALGQYRPATIVHSAMGQPIARSLLKMKLPSGDWCDVLQRESGLSAPGIIPWDLFQANPGKKWYLLQNNEAYFSEATSPSAILGEMVPSPSGEIFESRMLVTIKPLGRSWNLVMKAAERHAETLNRDPDLIMLQCITFVDDLLGLMVKPIPGLLQRFFVPTLTQHIIKWRDPFVNRFLKTWRETVDVNSQTDKVRDAIAAISVIDPTAEHLSAFTAIQFTGHGATIEEVFNDDHEWIVG